MENEIKYEIITGQNFLEEIRRFQLKEASINGMKGDVYEERFDEPNIFYNINMAKRRAEGLPNTDAHITRDILNTPKFLTEEWALRLRSSMKTNIYWLNEYSNFQILEPLVEGEEAARERLRDNPKLIRNSDRIPSITSFLKKQDNVLDHHLEPYMIRTEVRRARNQNVTQINNQTNKLSALNFEQIDSIPKEESEIYQLNGIQKKLVSKYKRKMRQAIKINQDLTDLRNILNIED